MNIETQSPQAAGSPEGLLSYNGSQERRNREKQKSTVEKYRDAINVYLREPYTYTVPEDPVKPNDYAKNAKSMARANNVLEVISALDLLIHPRLKMVSPEVAKKLDAKRVVLRKAIGNKLTENFVFNQGLVFDPEQAKSIAAEIEQSKPEQYLDRTYRTQEEVDEIKLAIQGIVDILNQEILRLAA